MEAPKCKICGERHWGHECGTVHGTIDAITVTLKPVVHSKKPMTVGPEAKVIKPPTKFDRNAYQRDYMRKKRAKDKEKLK